MGVALVHYHLRAGGVTRVLEAQSQALHQAGISHIILAGSPYQGPGNLPVAVVPALDYSSETSAQAEKSLSAELRRAARIALRGDPTVWHLHNPTLGKNALLPSFIKELAGAQEQLVLHFHDFAEDGRPGNYQLLRDHTQIYPLAPQIRYAFINSRDRALLVNAGVPEEQTTFLPNAVTPPAMAQLPERTTDDHPLVLYPVRGIRRKNLGEFCLLAGLAPTGTSFALSLPPDNPQWRPVYNQWSDAVEQFHLPVELGVVGRKPPHPGLEHTYASWLAHCSHLITTSVAEGFGLSFLEPLGLGKPLLGRDLPEITVDFKDDGWTLGDLYERLLVPRAWIKEERLLDHLRQELRQVYHAYGHRVPNGVLKDTHQALSCHDHLDFANLPEALQLEVLPHALVSPHDVLIARDDTHSPARTWLEQALSNTSPSTDSSALDFYSVNRYAELHAALYRGLSTARTQSPSWLDREAVLAQFLHPERFHFLRT